MSELVSNPGGRVAGSILRHRRAWRALPDLPGFVRRWLAVGFRIPLGGRKPPAIHLLNRPLSPEHISFVHGEVHQLLSMGAISPCSTRPRVVSPLGVVPKKEGKLRLILDLTALNRYVRAPPFRMEDMRAVAAMTQPGDLGATVDLQDGYFHLQVRHQDRELLGFEWDGVYYVYNVLPFGLSTSPWAFTKLVRPVVAALHRAGVRVTSYMDDFLVLAGPEEGSAPLDKTLALLRCLGWFVHPLKSYLTPMQDFTYLGMRVSTGGESVLISALGDKIRTVKKLAAPILASVP